MLTESRRQAEVVKLGCCALISAIVWLAASTAVAQIRSPNAHPQYAAELEPHLAIDFGGDDDIGLGLRATFEVMDPGFVRTINNNVGIGVGLDLLLDDDCCDRDRIHLPVVLQWNFWFSRHWSAFLEPGLVFKFIDDDRDGDDDDDVDLDLALYLGGRYNFTDEVALTLRLGTPLDMSIGVSFFL